MPGLSTSYQIGKRFGLPSEAPANTTVTADLTLDQWNASLDSSRDLALIESLMTAVW